MVQYPYLNEDSHFTLKNIRNAIKKRFSVVAEQASDFVIKLKTQNVIKSLDDVVMAGFSFGGHISAYTCRSLEKIFKQKVKALFGKLHFTSLFNLKKTFNNFKWLIRFGPGWRSKMDGWNRTHSWRRCQICASDLNFISSGPKFLQSLMISK